MRFVRNSQLQKKKTLDKFWNKIFLHTLQKIWITVKVHRVEEWFIEIFGGKTE